MGSNDYSVQAVGTNSADRAEQVKKYREKYNAVMQGIGTFAQNINNIWQNGANGNIDISGVSVFGNKDNSTCAFNS